jgi:hypothetical protein
MRPTPAIVRWEAKGLCRVAFPTFCDLPDRGLPPADAEPILSPYRQNGAAPRERPAPGHGGLSSMSGTILSIRPRQREPLPPLGLGERVINGRLYYSAAWLGAAAFEPETVQIGPGPTDADDKPKEEQMDGTVRFSLEGRGDEANTAEWIARLVARLLREEGLVVGERGVGVRASRSRTAHADVREEA